MENVILKGSKSGIKLVLNKDLPFDALLSEIEETFKKSGSFFKDALMALEFEGREMSNEEADKVVDIISNNTSIKIACIVNDGEVEKQYAEIINSYKSNSTSGSSIAADAEKHVASNVSTASTVSDNNADDAELTALFYKGTVRSGQVLESANSLVVIGDVNPGGKIIAKGSVIVLGALKGIVYAGGDDNEKAFVIAMDMSPMQIKICDIIARSSDSSNKRNEKYEPKIAFIEDENIYIEPLGKEVLNDINI